MHHASPSASSSGKDETITGIASRLWRGWSPLQVGIATMLVFLVPSLATIWNMHQQSVNVLSNAFRSHLIECARVMSTQVDASTHATFLNPAQETSDAYQAQIAKFFSMRSAVDSKGIIKFVYTCVQKDGAIHFVLDDTPQGDADGDGVDDKAHIMEPYLDASDALRRVFTEHVAQVDIEPYTDKWGTFIGAYAPIHDDQHKVVGVTGVDVEVADFELQLADMHFTGMVSAIGALCLAALAALVMARYHQGLMRSFSELVTLNETALSASRAKTNFLATMSHELRTPLNAIIGHADMLAGSARAEQQQSVAEIQTAADSLLGVITDILQYTSMDNATLVPQPKPVRLAALFKQVMSQFARQARHKGLVLEAEVDSSCPERLLLDAEQVKQVLSHLINNGLKFTDKGKVRVQARYEQDGQLHLIVSDSGIGVSDEKRSRLFEIFDQGDTSSTRKHGGLGIGLAICKRLCEAMQGSIWLEETSATGTVFHVAIPAQIAHQQGVLWLVTREKLTGIIVRNVAEKLGLKIEVVDEAAKAKALPEDLVLVDVSSVNPSGLKADRAIALNAESGAVPDSMFRDALPLPAKPAEIRRLLEYYL